MLKIFKANYNWNLALSSSLRRSVLLLTADTMYETVDIIKKYEDKISYWVSEPDKGISDAFNKGIKKSSGELIGIINSDDMLLPNSLQFISESIEEASDVLFGNGLKMYTNGYTKKYMSLSAHKLYECMALVHPSVFIRKRAYIKYGLFI